MNAARAVKLGDGDLYVAGGVENMTRAPYVMAKADAAYDRGPREGASSSRTACVVPMGGAR